MEKPVTMLIDEFKAKTEDLLNNSGLPAWLMIYVLDPYMRQLNQVYESSREKERADYEKSLQDEQEKEVNNG